MREWRIWLRTISAARVLGSAILRVANWSRFSSSWVAPRSQTTERYLGCKQKLRHAVNDAIGLKDA